MSAGDPLSGRDLAAFVAAVESGTVQGAADALDLTQSAASKRVHALERRLGEPVLLRTPQGVEVTAAGRRLYPEAKEALAALGRAESAVSGRTSAPVLRIAASHTIGEFLLPGWLAGFRSAGNPVAAHVEIINSPGVVDALRAGRAEVGCVEGPDSADGMESLTLMEDEIVAVVAPDHPWAAAAEIPVAALAAESFSTRERGSGTRAVVTERLAEAGQDLQPELEVASTQSLKRAVLQGGFTLLSRLAVEDEIRAGTLVAVRVGDVSLQRPLRAIRPRQGVRSAVAREWWRWLAAGVPSRSAGRARAKGA
jgi:DNA-binding transcriptional LysR family regulator